MLDWGPWSARAKMDYLRGNHPQPIQHALFSPLPPPPPPPRRYKTGRRLRRRQISITARRRAGGASWIILDSLSERVEILQSTEMRFARWKEAERRRSRRRSRRAILLCGFDSASCAISPPPCLPSFLPLVSLVSMSCLFRPTDRDRLQELPRTLLTFSQI